MTKADFQVLVAAFPVVSEYEAACLRYKAGEPLSHITGAAQFLDRTFFVDRRVFVPTTETEALASAAIDAANALTAPLVADVGTGCGNIAISLALSCPHARVVGTDVSSDAIEIARLNAERHNAHNTSFHVMDLLGHLSVAPDLIVADLPYGSSEHLLHSIDINRYASMPPVARFTDGLVDAYLRLISQIKKSKLEAHFAIRNRRRTGSDAKAIHPE